MPKTEGQRRRERERQKRRRRERAIALATAAGNDPNLEVQPVRRIRCHRPKKVEDTQQAVDEAQRRALYEMVRTSRMGPAGQPELSSVVYMNEPPEEEWDDAETEIHIEQSLQSRFSNNSGWLRPSAYGRWFRTNSLYVPLGQVTDFPIASFIGKCLYVDRYAADRGVTLPEHSRRMQYVRIVDVAAGQVHYTYYLNRKLRRGYLLASQSMTQLYVCTHPWRRIGLRSLLTKPFPHWPSQWDKQTHPPIELVVPMTDGATANDEQAGEQST